ncbi:hypothetical protein KSB_54040 [Ktedonobacter robiniae]|uniref:Uncharacterized protein n=1 Tax=Ktedonobacter robiniae TaxID=2778365 RepID=A0ABQ3UVQ2_9CHLR|nr:hypothetical protein KSB_54040 [Ktedonobacter robiniae]
MIGNIYSAELKEEKRRATNVTQATSDQPGARRNGPYCPHSLSESVVSNLKQVSTLPYRMQTGVEWLDVPGEEPDVMRQPARVTVAS